MKQLQGIGLKVGKMADVLKLHKSLYNRKIISKASYDYNGLADIQIKDTDNYTICIFNNCKADLQLIKKEFSNYLIALMVKEKGLIKK